jgi:hypothetical protein
MIDGTVAFIAIGDRTLTAMRLGDKQTFLDARKTLHDIADNSPDAVIEWLMKAMVEYCERHGRDDEKPPAGADLVDLDDDDGGV